jgi:alkylated DNA repair protein (DNA oxidative demethylase)
MRIRDDLYDAIRGCPLNPDLFAQLADDMLQAEEPMAEGAVLLRGFAAAVAPELIGAIAEIERAAPFRRMMTPGGHLMSVAMTNCGSLGWVTDRSGYRYVACDPDTGRPWPTMPAAFGALAIKAADRAGFAGFKPDACLINR